MIGVKAPIHKVIIFSEKQMLGYIKDEGCYWDQSYLDTDEYMLPVNSFYVG